MEVKIEHIRDTKYKATTSKSSFIIDTTKITPVEYFAAGIIGCTSVDIIELAKRDGFVVKNFQLKANIERSNSIPAKFNKIELIYKFDGSFDDIKAKRYVLSSLESYCTTINSIRDSVKVLYTIIFNGKNIANKESIASGKKEETIFDDGFGAPVCCPS
ncbi:MAG: OsmC family peroxiredoxin [Epsilonproteobacteria bacterium]|nr:OsmC family peroxiredoxin [Campylobacterota bacterium]